MKELKIVRHADLQEMFEISGTIALSALPVLATLATTTTDAVVSMNIPGAF